MSKIPYTVDVNRSICEELAAMRQMIETHDYSSLDAHIEHVQYHANNMESALYERRDKLWEMEDKIRKFKSKIVKLKKRTNG